MGADLLMIAIPVTLTEEEAIARMRKTKLTKLLDALRAFDDGVSFDAFLYGEYEVEEGDWTTLPTIAKAVEKFLTYEIRTFYGYLQGHREIAYQVIAGKTYYFTGGPSWGDTPTEPYDNFSLMYELGVTDIEENVDA